MVKHTVRPLSRAQAKESPPAQAPTGIRLFILQVFPAGLAVQPGTVAAVQIHNRQIPEAGLQHNFRRMGIDTDIEFPADTPGAALRHTAHDADLFYILFDIRMFLNQDRNIG